MGRKSILLTHLKCLYFFYLNIITILSPHICPMSDETRQNRSKRDKMRQDIKLLIIATILQPDNLKIQYLCPFPAIIHYSTSILPSISCVRKVFFILYPVWFLHIFRLVRIFFEFFVDEMLTCTLSLYYIGPVVLRAINQVRKNSLNGTPKCIVTAIHAYPRRIFLPSSIILDSLVYSSSNIHRPFSVITYHFCRPS